MILVQIVGNNQSTIYIIKKIFKSSFQLLDRIMLQQFVALSGQL